MDEYCRMVFEYLQIVSAPVLGSPLDVLLVVILAASLVLAISAAVALVSSRLTVSVPASASAIVPGLLDHVESRVPWTPARARAPSVGAVLRA